MTLQSVAKGGLAALLSLLIAVGPVAAVAQETAPLPAAPVPYSPAAAPTAPATPGARFQRRRARPVAPRPAAPVIAPPVNPAAGVVPLNPAELQAFVDGVVTEAMAGQKIAGVGVSIVQNGQVILKKGYGYDRLSPARRVDPDRTLFRLASISKTFTWISVMRQVEAGRIRLDAPINLFLPEAVRVPDQGMERQVRVIDLMNHRTGFEDRAMGQLFEKDADRVRPLLTYLRQERPRREWEPGTVPAYSNYGVSLAGEAVAWQAQKPFEEVIEQEITRPLGMWRTTFRDPYPARAGLPAPMPKALAADLSEGYFWTGASYAKRPYEFTSQIAPAGGASSTPADMARYMTMLLNGGTLDGATIFNPQTAAGFRQVGQRSLPGVSGFAHGFMTYSLPGGRTGYGHDGDTLTFHSRMVVVPQLGLGVFVVVNTDNGDALRASLASRIVQQFYVGGDGARAPTASQWLKDNANAFEGEYLSSRRAFHGMEKFIGLFNGRTTAVVDREGQLVLKSFGAESAWTPTSTDGRFTSTRDSRTIAFEMKDGRAVGFYNAAGSAFSHRVGLFGGQAWLGWLALMTIIAAIATLVGSTLRLRLNLRQTTIQARASLIQTIQGVLWVIAFVSVGLWSTRIGDVSAIFYDWPGGLLLTASACAFVAAILSLIVVILTPFVWQGGRRVDSFTSGRKLRFSFTAALYLVFSIFLAFWGAIFPWTS